MSKRELNRIVKQAQFNAVISTIAFLAIYSIGLAGIIYMFIK